MADLAEQFDRLPEVARRLPLGPRVGRHAEQAVEQQRQRRAGTAGQFRSRQVEQFADRLAADMPGQVAHVTVPGQAGQRQRPDHRVQFTAVRHPATGALPRQQPGRGRCRRECMLQAVADLHGLALDGLQQWRQATEQALTGTDLEQQQ